MNPARQTLLGVVFFGSLIGLGVLTVFLRDSSFLKDKTEYTVLFDQVNGLRVGDEVFVYGTKLGQVSNIVVSESPLPEERVHVTITTYRVVPFREDYRILIRDSSLLGGKIVEMLVGSPEANLWDGPYRGTALEEPLRALQLLIEDNRDQVSEAIGKLAQLASDIADGKGSLGKLLTDEGLYEGIQGFIASAERVMREIDTGDGTLTKLIRDPALYDNLDGFADSANKVAKEIAEGRGSLGRLIYEDQLYANVDKASQSAAKLIDRLEKGEGLLGKLMNEESDPVLDDLKDLVADGKVLMRRLRDDKGILGRLISDEQLGDKFDRILNDISLAAADISSITNHVRQGGGTLGLLLYDRFTRDRLAGAVDQLTGAIEDAREAAPVSSIAGFLLGTF